MVQDDNNRSNTSIQRSNPPPEPSSKPDTSSPSESQSPGTLPTSPLENRAELLNRARSFLMSPQIPHEDIIAKRRFLVEKGLSDAEIAGLLQELVSLSRSYSKHSVLTIGMQPMRAPLVPPRTYPPPSPSNLPNLLIGLLRIFTWVAAGSATLILVYYVC